MPGAFFGYIGIACALVFASKFPYIQTEIFHKDLGAAYGTAKSGVGIASMGVLKPELIFKSIVPIIMAGILGIYGLIVSVILVGKSTSSFIY
jgi:V-type H+-transporting ATPase 16kDa proteolipid subunit